jgi:hypothetical protein
MGIYFQPDKILQVKAATKLRKILLRKSFMERWEPVSSELNWFINGCPNEEQHQKILPDYCYNIFDLYRRTLFKAFTPMSEVFTIKDKERAATCKTVAEAKQIMTIDWEKLGSVFAIGERGQAFFENEVEQKLKQDGFLDLTPEQNDDIYKLIFGERWLKKKSAEIQAQEPDKPLEEIIEKRCSTLGETIKKAVPEWHQKAREWDPEAVIKFHAGVAKGSAGFLDKDGELKGVGKIKLSETYEFLLLAWPEIEEMLRAKPPKTRNQLWEWLLPFSYARWIEIQDLEQLNRLCTVIKLKLKKPGAPRKVK